MSVKVTMDGTLGLYQETIGVASPSLVVNSDVPVTTNGTLTANGDVTVNGMANLDKVSETYVAKSGATGVVEHDCSTTHIFYHTTPAANWTVNLTSLSLADGFSTTVTIVVYQNGSPYIPTALKIGGGADKTINWQGNVTPTTGTANRIDVVSFSILNVGGTYRVLGQLVSF